ncbi:hypothetical protein ScPMuIL_011445 [Solemya velum]
MKDYCTFKVWSVVLGVLALLWIVGGFVAPGWVVVSLGTGNLYFGLWYTIPGNTSYLIGNETVLPEDNYMDNNMLQLTLTGTPSVIPGFLGLLCTLMYVNACVPGYRRCLVMLAVSLYLVSVAVLGFVVLTCFSINSQVAGGIDDVNRRFNVSPPFYVIPPFSAIMCIIGAGIEFISSLIHIREFWLCKATPRVIHHTQPGQGSADPPPEYSVTVHSTQMAQYPAPMENQPTPADCRDDEYLIQA